MPADPQVDVNAPSTASVQDQAVEALNLLDDNDKLKVVAYIHSLNTLSNSEQ